MNTRNDVGDSIHTPWGLIGNEGHALFDVYQINPWMLFLAEISLPYANETDQIWMSEFLEKAKQKEGIEDKVSVLKKSLLKF